MAGLIEATDLESCKSYWENLHRHKRDSMQKIKYNSDKLNAICCPGSPYLYNRLIDHFQKISFWRCLKECSPLTGKKVLDVGCGTGRWSRLMAKQGAYVTAIDLSVDVISYVQSKFKEINFKVMELTKLEFPGGSFDLVTSVTVLQHIPYQNQDKAISEICRTVRKKRGGIHYHPGEDL
jgi:2-polyprenyl-3-methyl-5-hydroxy-6-metoxy-1,4-benzoquinol methylase